MLRSEIIVTHSEAQEILSAAQYYHNYCQNVYSQDSVDKANHLITTGEVSYGQNVFYVIKEMS